MGEKIAISAFWRVTFIIFAIFFLLTISSFSAYCETLTVDATKIKSQINPLIFGTNLYAHTETRQQIKDFASDIGLTVFRFPGGGSPGYHWETMSFDFSTNLTVDNCPLLNFDYLVDFAGEIGGEILYQVNTETGTPSEAAALLAHLNSNGRRVTYWEIGNEVYGNWDHNNYNGRPSDYADLVCQYHVALKAVDPTVKIGADFGGSYYDSVNWDSTVMFEAGDCIDFISYHWYTGRATTEIASDVMGNYLKVKQDVERFNAIIADEAPSRVGHIEITYPEWDTVFNDSEMRDSLANAIAYADSLGEMMNAGVTVTNHYSFQEGDDYHDYHGFGLIPGWDSSCRWSADWGEVQDKSWDEQRIKPKAFALKLFRKKFGQVLLESELTGTTTYTKSSGSSSFEYLGAVPYVSAYAGIDSSGETLSIILISKKSSAATDVTINLTGFEVKNPVANVSIITGPSLESVNNDTPGTVNLTETTISGVSESFSYSLAPRSVVSIQLSGLGSGDYDFGDDDDDDDLNDAPDNNTGNTLKVTSGCGIVSSKTDISDKLFLIVFIFTNLIFLFKKKNKKNNYS